MLDEQTILKEAAAKIDKKLSGADDQKLKPYVDLVEYGIRQGILKEQKLTAKVVLRACDNAVMDVYNRHGQLLAVADRSLMNELTGKLLEDYKGVAMAVRFVFAYHTDSEVLDVPIMLKELYGEAWSIAREQYHLDQMVKADGHDDTLSI